MPEAGLTIVRAVLPRRLGTDGGAAFDVRPPTVQEAMEVLYLLRYGDPDSDADDRRLLILACQHWMGEEYGLAIGSLPAADVGECARRWILEGTEDKEKKDAKKKDDQDDDADEDPHAWLDVLFDYCLTFRCEPWSTYQTLPFPFLKASAPYVRRASAKKTLGEADIELLPHMKKQARHEFIRRVVRDARRGRRRVKATPRTEADVRAEMDRLSAAMSGYTR